VDEAGVAVVEALRCAGVGKGDLVGLAVAPEVGVGLATAGGTVVPVAVDDPATVVRQIEDELRPRWVVWSSDTAGVLVAAGLRIATCWDVVAVHRLIAGGWWADPARAWAQAHDLDPAGLPQSGPVDLFSMAEHDATDPEQAVRDDGYLDPDWPAGAWAATPERLARWAALALEVAGRQHEQVSSDPIALRTARSESTAELLCAELSADGLPVDKDAAEAIIGSFAGPRPRSEADSARERAKRDDQVLRHAPQGSSFDLRSPGQVKSLLRRIGIEVPDTRAHRLEGLRDTHPLIDALLVWRKAERVATTYGYGWLDQHLSPDGRLRGAWTGSDGAAGRMTASAGLHNMPADMRGAVIAEPGHVFVRADLGQIEPRVLAAVSGDQALARATQDDDLYAPVAQQLGVDRATAKVAVLGAMYGQTTGHGAQVLPRLHAAYPVAMAYLDAGDRDGQASRDLRTYGGRRVRMGADDATQLSDREIRGRAAARGRYGRNALVQGAAAELFKVWAVTFRARGADLDARIVLCLHDELLVHVPLDHSDAAAALVESCLHEAAHRWCPATPVRFVADTSVIPRWSDAKG
jgi:DNA polymerase-1